MNCAETASPIDLQFGLRTRVDPKKHKFNRIRQVAPMLPHVKAHWRHLVNTIEPSVCCGDAALCQITLTTCYYYYKTNYNRFLLVAKATALKQQISKFFKQI